MTNNAMSTEIATSTNQGTGTSIYTEANSFELAQRRGKALMASNLVPEEYKDNLPNCLIALEIAQRIGASPLMVMQNLNIIHGRPSWSSQFIIAALNSCGRFSPLRFKIETTDGDTVCTAYAIDKSTSDVLEGPQVSLSMAKAEGWSTKNGSKWKTMPDLMLRYRAAAFFGRLYAPDVLMGMHAVEEVEDFSSAPAQLIEKPKAGDRLAAIITTVSQNEIDATGGTHREPVEETDVPI